MNPRFPNSLIRPLVPALIVAGLFVDQYGGRWGQPVVVVATWIAFLVVVRASNRAGRIMMLLCLAFATFGEILLSPLWHVYDYRLGTLPWFVPPGHVLLFLLGMSIAPHVSERVVRVLAIAAASGVTVLATTHRDTLSVPLVIVFLASVALGRERRLYATMFVLALAMELYGTWLGNWQWHTLVAHTGLITLNPPLAAGAFYCALDLLVMLTTRAIGSSSAGAST